MPPKHFNTNNSYSSSTGKGHGSNGGGGGGGNNNGNRNNNNQNKNPPICRRCGQVGHTANVCFTQVATDNHTPAPATPLPPHSAPFIDSHLHCDYICEQSRSPTFGTFLAKTEMPPTLLGGITTLCDSTAICSSMLSQREDLAQNHKDRIFFTIGLHPHNAKYFDDRIVMKMLELMTPTTTTTTCDPTTRGENKNNNSKRQGDNDDDDDHVAVATSGSSFADLAVVGFGEIGLDVDSFKKGGTKLDDQIPVFLQQVQMARGMLPHLPLQLHLRGDKGGVGDLIQFLPFDELASAPAVHFHCYGDPNVDTAKMLARRVPNCVFGFTGMICGNASAIILPSPSSSNSIGAQSVGNNNSENAVATVTATSASIATFRYPCIKKFEELLRWLPLDKFVLESDSPYMVPAPVRNTNTNNENGEEDDDEAGYKNAAGKNINFKKNNKGPPLVNHSGHLPFIAAAIADVKGISIDLVLEHAYENTLRVYPKLQRVWRKREFSFNKKKVEQSQDDNGNKKTGGATSQQQEKQKMEKSSSSSSPVDQSKFPDLNSLSSK